MQGFGAQELAAWRSQGYVIARGLADAAACARMKAVTERDLAAAVQPIEYEADVHYPGAPASREAPGGATARRLLQAYARDPAFAAWATAPALAVRLHQMLGPRVLLSQAHHNCIMTKQPRYSSRTLWHRDIRYWSFQRAELASVWLALGPETVDNGCLLVLPGTQDMEFDAARKDEAQFLRTDLEENRALLDSAVPVELAAGDVLFFHCRLFHAAGANRTTATKLSPVFTYHAADNLPLPGSRSAALPDISLA